MVLASVPLLTTRDDEATTTDRATVTPVFRNSRPPAVASNTSRFRLLFESPRHWSAVMPRVPWNRLTVPVNELDGLFRLNPLEFVAAPVRRSGVASAPAELITPA